MSGFSITAYNAGSVDGEAGFDFLALEENGQRRHFADLRFGIGQPRVLQAAGIKGDWAAYTTNFGRPLDGAPRARILTAHNMGETGSYTPLFDQQKVEEQASWAVTLGRESNTVAAVGIGCEQFTAPASGMAYMARSGDTVGGKVGFNWAAALPSRAETTVAGLIADSGIVLPHYFKSDPNQDEWQYQEVHFSRPFSETPVVFLTGFFNRDLSASNLPLQSAASIGVVFNATRFGFTLAARNVEDRDGQTGFFWVALGCGEGCGGGVER